ncbi:MAG: SIMPL domain-containing protein [Phycisphaerales bacterium]
MPIEAAAAVPTVGVSGTGEVSVKPDRATVRIGASHQADTAIEAQSRVNEIIDEATKAIRALDIEGLVIQTSGLSLSAVYDYRRDQEPRIIGYRSSISLSVRIDDIDRTGRVIDAAMSTGANQLQGVEFSLQDDGEARREALKRAVHDARSKADAIADALGRSLVGLVEVREQGVSVPVLRRGAESGEMMRMSADAAPTPIEAGEISVRANVEITYSLGSGN